MREAFLNFGLGIALLTAPNIGAAGTRPQTVKIENMQFAPLTLTVHRGETVEWTNDDLVPHTVTSVERGRFDSQSIAPGAKWKFTARHKGTFKYKCSFHPTMEATLIVQ